jgi:hypothetical protein
MVRTALVPVATSTAGLVPALVNADNANGMSYPAKPGRFIWVKNTNAAPCNVTISFGPAATEDSIAPANRVVAVPANTGERLIGPMPQFYTQADGMVYLDFSVGGATTQVGVVDVNG